MDWLLFLVSGYCQIPTRMQERDAFLVLSRNERAESDEEIMCIINNECVEGTGIEEGWVTVVERLKKEFSVLNGSGLKNYGKVLLTHSVINTEDAEPVRNSNSRVSDH